MKKTLSSLLLIPVAATLLFSCGAKKPDKGGEVAIVNGSPIFMKDLVAEVNMNFRREPGMKLTEERIEEILHTMIDRKLLIEEAVKQGLSEDERFLASIKSFWEQTLIRELVEAKNREWADRLLVTDEEIKERHALMQSKVTVRFIKAHDMKEAEAAIGRLSVEGTVLGPLFMEDMRPTDPFFSAFAMAPGESKAVLHPGHDDDFYAFVVVKKEPAGAPALDEVYAALKAGLLDEKKERALEEWLESRKKAAAIKINEGALEGLKR